MRNRIWRITAVLAAAAAWAAVSCEGPVEPPEGPVPWDYYPIKGLNERESVADVYMLSASEGWAVANEWQGGPYFLHFDGSEWSVEEDLSAEYPDVTVMRLSFSTADDGWAVGHAYLPSGRYGGHVFHYDGRSWVAVTDIPVDLKYYYRFYYDVEAIAPDDIWLTGGRGVLHYNGETWEEFDVDSRLTAFSFSKPNEGWGVGDGRYYRWEGSAWQRVSGLYGSALDIGSPSDTTAWTVGGFLGG